MGTKESVGLIANSNGAFEIGEMSAALQRDQAGIGNCLSDVLWLFSIFLPTHSHVVRYPEEAQKSNHDEQKNRQQTIVRLFVHDETLAGVYGLRKILSKLVIQDFHFDFQ